MSSYTHPEVLADTQWLADHLADPQVRIVEGDINTANYDAGHISGAVFWNVLATIVLPDFRYFDLMYQ